tara:strand:+ start:40098 stop:40691 length:594 start_codon:yes stop_codon:yes gene_type:complete
MKLYYSPASPFARKVRISAILLGLENEVTLETVDVFNDNSYSAVNPLVKIPTLQTREGLFLTNSPYIVDYLDSLSSTTKMIPTDGSRWQALQFQSIADGIMDAAVLRRLESLRSPDKQDSKFDLRQKQKIQNGMRYFESNIDLLKMKWTVSEISLCCAIGYLNYRFGSENWLAEYPKLNHWYTEANRLDCVARTMVK